MKKSFARRLGFGLWIAFAAPALLRAGANVWTGSRLTELSLDAPTLVASQAGEPDTVYSAQDSQLFQSLDGGRTWARVGSFQGATFQGIFGLYVDPVSGAVLVGAPGPGPGYSSAIYKSTDAGRTWTQTFDSTVGTQFSVFASSPRSPSVLYASARYAILRSDDAGDTWQDVNRPFVGGGLSQVVEALVIDPSDGTTVDAGGYDYAYPNYDPLAPFFRKTTDTGATWTDYSTDLGSHSAVSAIAVDPSNPKNIFLGMKARPAVSVFRSNEDGSFTPAQVGLPPHAEVTSLLIDPQDSRTLYAGTDSGVFRTRDSGASWQPLGQLLSGTAVGALTIDPPSDDSLSVVLRATNGYGSFALEVGTGALDIAAGAGRSHVLSWDVDSLTVQTAEDSGQNSSTPPEGPSSSWLASAIADGADGLSRVLWVSGDGRAALEIVGAAGRQAVFQFGALPLWSAADVSVAQDGTAHVLWTSQSGAMYLASVDAAGAVTLGPSYGPYPNWTALALADAPDGSTWVLWRATDGRFSISIHHALVMGPVLRLPAIAARAAEDITVASDGSARVLLVGEGSIAEVATVDASGTLSNAERHSPPAVRPRRISAGPDGLTRLLFSSFGVATILPLNPDNTLHSQAGPGSGSYVGGDWIGTFESIDFVDCEGGTAASASFTQNGSTVEGVLHMTHSGCGADGAHLYGTIYGTLEGPLLKGIVEGGSGFAFDPGSTVLGWVTEETTLELTLSDNSPYNGPLPIPGGTLYLHRAGS